MFPFASNPDLTEIAIGPTKYFVFELSITILRIITILILNMKLFHIQYAFKHANRIRSGSHPNKIIYKLTVGCDPRP
jgi:hypothetical protein